MPPATAGSYVLTMRQVVVTGAGGFVGTAVVRALAGAGWRTRALVRSASTAPVGAASVVAGGDLTAVGDWAPIVEGADVVVHLAARAHRSDGSSDAVLDEYRRINRDATIALAAAAAAAGVRRFVFLSSIGVLGERTTERPFTAADPRRPEAPYAISKAEAEEGLAALAARTSLEVVIIRPPLICGPGAPGNLRRLLRLAASPWPLPFGAVRNRRTFVGLPNLVELISVAAEHPAAPGEPLLAGDDAAVSTTTLLQWMRRAFERAPRLIPVPLAPMHLLASAVGAGRAFTKMTGSLEVDSTATTRRVGWRPRVPTAESVDSMARAFAAGAA